MFKMMLEMPEEMIAAITSLAVRDHRNVENQATWILEQYLMEYERKAYQRDRSTKTVYIPVFKKE